MTFVSLPKPQKNVKVPVLDASSISTRKRFCALMRLGVSAENVKITEVCFGKELKELGVDPAELKRAEGIIRAAMDRLEYNLGLLSPSETYSIREALPHLNRSWGMPDEARLPKRNLIGEPV